MNQKIIRKSLLLILVSILNSCSNTLSPATVDNNVVATSPQVSSENKIIKDESKKPEPVISKDSSSDEYSSERSEGLSSATRPMASATSAPTLPSGAYSPDIISDSTTSNSAISSKETYSKTPLSTVPAKRLSAGDTDDNFKFNDYLTYINSITGLSKNDIIKVDVSQRVIISIKDKDGKSVPDSLIQISYNGINVFEGKTYSNGKVLFMPSNLGNCQQQNCSYKVTVQKNNEKISKEFQTSSNEWNINLENQRQIPQTINLDLNFLIDATGSMGDEINSIQKTIKDISTKINQISDKKLNIRYSLVSYKDRNEQYRVKRYDFTTNLQSYQEILNELTAGGGGDYKECLNEGLNNSIDKISWTKDSEAIKLVFLVADAPPHIDYQDDIQYTESIKLAVNQGIKIYPVSASGLDPSGEYIFRQLAQMTYAKFLFITYGGDEQTQGTTPHNVGTFKENNLDDLVVNIIKDEISQFTSN